MKTAATRHALKPAGFSLLEMMLTLAVVALVLGAVHTVTQGTLTLADTITRAQRQDSRHQAFTAFCDRLFGTLPAEAALNLKTEGSAGQYLSTLEIYNVASPFDGLPGRVVTLYTETSPGGTVELKMDCRLMEEKEPYSSVVLFEDLGMCEWRVWSAGAAQWSGEWKEPVEREAQRNHPPLVELTMNAPGTGTMRRVFWVAPNTTPVFNPQQPQVPNNPNAPTPQNPNPPQVVIPPQ